MSAADRSVEQERAGPSLSRAAEIYRLRNTWLIGKREALVLVSVYAAQGAALRNATLDGRREEALLFGRRRRQLAQAQRRQDAERLGTGVKFIHVAQILNGARE